MDFIEVNILGIPYSIHNNTKYHLVSRIVVLSIDAKLHFKIGMATEANILQSFDAQYFLEMMANLEKSEWTY